MLLNLTSSTFYDVICLTERGDQFLHSNCSKEPFFVKDVFSFMHIDKRLCISSLYYSPHLGRPKTVENKGSIVRYNKIINYN